MCAVAEGAVLRLTATAQGHRILTRRDGEGVAQVIDNAHRSLDHVRTVLPTADFQWFGHESFSPVAWRRVQSLIVESAIAPRVIYEEERQVLGRVIQEDVAEAEAIH